MSFEEGDAISLGDALPDAPPSHRFGGPPGYCPPAAAPPRAAAPFAAAAPPAPTAQSAPPPPAAAAPAAPAPAVLAPAPSQPSSPWGDTQPTARRSIPGLEDFASELHLPPPAAATAGVASTGSPSPPAPKPLATQQAAKPAGRPPAKSPAITLDDLSESESFEFASAAYHPACSGARGGAQPYQLPAQVWRALV